MKSPLFTIGRQAAGAVLALTVPACAVAQVARIDAVVVTATRLPTPVSALVSDIRVIDAEAIAAAGQSTLAELLQSAGGVEIATSGGTGQVAGVFVRGTNANHVVVLVDGVRINSATTGTNAFENLPLAQIERIEILKGPASSLHGADAIGGVVQIFTRQGGNRVAASTGAGSWNTQRYTGSVAREFGATALTLNAGYESTRAFSATTPDNVFSYNPDADGYRNRNAGATLRHAFAPDQVLTARVLASEGTAHFDAGPDSDDVSRQRLTTYQLESRNRYAAGWTGTLRLARGTDDIVTQGGFPSAFRTDQDQASWQHEVAAAGGQIAAGAEYRRERIDSTTDFSATARNTRSVYAGYTTAFGPHLLQAAARHDDSSQYGGHDTGSLGYGYRLGGGWRVSGSVATAFKAPSFNDLYYRSPYFNGNPALEPERAKNAEIALRRDGDGWRGGITFYENRIRDLVAVDPTFSTVINVNRARIRGGTLNGEIDVAGFRLRGEWTSEEAIDEATGHRLPRRARNYGTLRVERAVGALNLAAEVVAAGTRYDSVSNAPGSAMAGYGRLDLRAAWTAAPGWTVSLRWNNVLDRKYTLQQGYATPGTNAFLWLSYAG